MPVQLPSDGTGDSWMWYTSCSVSYLWSLGEFKFRRRDARLTERAESGFVREAIEISAEHDTGSVGD